jgi:hypothetical protein
LVSQVGSDSALGGTEELRGDWFGWSCKLLDLGEERADDGLCFGRFPGDQFFRDFQRHARHGAEKSAAGQWPVTMEPFRSGIIQSSHAPLRPDVDACVLALGFACKEGALVILRHTG